MKKSNFRSIIIIAAVALLYLVSCNEENSGKVRPGHPEWPMAWTSYRKVKSLEEDIEDLKAHGIGLISYNARNAEDARMALEIAQRTGMKYNISLPDITEHLNMVKSAGLEPEPARLIGGVYLGKAIDRHLFTFTPSKHEIIIEPPVYSKGFPYTLGSGGTGEPKDTERIGHYFPDIDAPVKAEIIVPQKPFDGKQHLKIISAEISLAPEGTKLQIDSYSPDMPESSEITNRKLYKISFDLSGLDNAMLDHVGIAVYWEYKGTNQYWIFGRGNVSAWSENTQNALRYQVKNRLDPWIDANNGEFPHKTVLAARFGDECFYITSHLNGPAVNYPLWEYSQSSIEVFYKHAGIIEYPRTWGFPEIYGTNAYAWWMYTLHEGTANLAAIVQDELNKVAPELMLFRNQTRMGIFHLSNDHDGSGQELLSQNMDIVHLDPYPVGGSGYGKNIPRDMSYCAGIARRYDRLLIPWMQAHTYGGQDGLQHISPEDVDRMAQEQWEQGVDAIMWLGYGNTFPEARPDSWEQAAKFHRKLKESPPPKPKAELAVIRSYKAWALSSHWENKLRNPADWKLQQFLEVWAVDYGLPYDVFEIAPELTQEEQLKLASQLKKYQYIVSTEPIEGAWHIDKNSEGQVIDTEIAPQIRQQFEEELKQKGWL